MTRSTSGNKGAAALAKSKAGSTPPKPTGPAKLQKNSSHPFPPRVPTGSSPASRLSNKAAGFAGLGRLAAGLKSRGITTQAQATKATVGTPGTPATSTTTRTPVAPFLTAAQQNAETQYGTTYNYNIQALNQKLADSTIATNANLAAAQKTHDVNTDNTNQATAARGLFQSSIRAGDLNDIDTALAARNNILNTSLNSLTLATQTNEQRLQTNYLAQQNLYNQMAVTNAENAPPSAAVTTTTPAVPGTAPAMPALTTTGGAPQPPGSNLFGNINTGMQNLQNGFNQLAAAQNTVRHQAASQNIPGQPNAGSKSLASKRSGQQGGTATTPRTPNGASGTVSGMG